MAVAVVVVVVVKKQFYEVGPKLLQQFFFLSLSFFSLKSLLVSE